MERLNKLPGAPSPEEVPITRAWSVAKQYGGRIDILQSPQCHTCRRKIVGVAKLRDDDSSDELFLVSGHQDGETFSCYSCYNRKTDLPVYSGFEGHMRIQDRESGKICCGCGEKRGVEEDFSLNPVSVVIKGYGNYLVTEKVYICPACKARAKNRQALAEYATEVVDLGSRSFLKDEKERLEAILANKIRPVIGERKRLLLKKIGSLGLLLSGETVQVDEDHYWRGSDQHTTRR